MTSLDGYRVLLGLYVRRDRWQVLAWVVSITLLYWSQAISIDGLYATQAELDTAAASMGDNAAFVALAGPARALNTVGGQVVWQATAIGAVLAGLMTMFLVGRHTRVEEEQGREELLRSAPVGRLAAVTAAATVAVLANLLVGVAVAVSLVGYGLAGADSWATGLGLTLTGWVFTGTALVAMQVTASSRSAYGIAGAVLGTAYALRAVGDVTGSGLSWVSPIGWYQGLHPFSGLRWWPALLLVAAALAGVAAAYGLLLRRDVGSGLVSARPGSARGSLGSGLALTWRLQRGSVIGWGVGLLLTGLSYGSIGDSVADLVGGSQASKDLFAVSGGDLVDGFYATSALTLALLAGGFAISSALRLRGEEDDGRAELLLATGHSRGAWLVGHAVVTLVGTLLVLAAGALGIGLGYGAATGSWGGVARLSLPVLSYAPSVLVCAGVALLLTGLVPRFATLSWTVLGWAVVVLLLGRTLRLPGWSQGLSPFDHQALVPAEAFAPAPVAVLALLAAALGVAAWLSLCRRDIQ